jgi:hypothetical protein
MGVTLTVTAGPHVGRAFEFDRHDTFVVGCAKDAHFQLLGDDVGRPKGEVAGGVTAKRAGPVSRDHAHGAKCQPRRSLATVPRQAWHAGGPSPGTRRRAEYLMTPPDFRDTPNRVAASA